MAALLHRRLRLLPPLPPVRTHRESRRRCSVYAPQRHRLPLISSRTSSAVFAWPSSQQRDGGADLPRRAVAALKRIVIDERLLKRDAACSPFCESFDRGNRSAVVHNRERKAGVDALPVHNERCTRRIVRGRSPSWCRSNGNVRAEVEQRRPGFDAECMLFAVDVEAHRHALDVARRDIQRRIRSGCIHGEVSPDEGDVQRALGRTQ